MAKINLLAATRSVEATMPFMLYRLGICLGTALASLFAALAGAGTLIAFASFSAKPGSAASFGALLGLGAFLYLIYRFRAGLFFNIQAGHLALLGDLLQGAKLPQGKAQVDLAKTKASALFPGAAGFQEINDATQQVLHSLPVRHCPWLGGLANQELAKHLGYWAGWLAQTASPALLTLAFADGKAQPWASVRRGLLLHVKSFDALSKSRFYLFAFEYTGLVLAFFAMLYPVDSAASLLPVDIGLWRYGFALIFAWSLKAAFLEPIATAALAELYFTLDQQDTGSNEQQAKQLEEASPAFRHISTKAE